jgi:hypothetical protein
MSAAMPFHFTSDEPARQRAEPDWAEWHNDSPGGHCWICGEVGAHNHANEGHAMDEQHKCAHPSCHCIVPAGTKYCSDYCKKAPEVELHCNCMHTDCRQKS